MSISLVAIAIALIPANDSARYVVLNHGRPAGEMIVASAGDSTTVRYWYVDRNRGPRSVARYRFGAQGEVLAVETRGLGADFRVTGVTGGFEVQGDSVRIRAGTGWRMEARGRGTIVRTGGTPYDDLLLVRALLRVPARRAPTAQGDTIRLDVAAETTLTVAGRSARVRMAVLDGLGFSPTVLWLDEHEDLFASQAFWFVTVQEGAESTLPALRALEQNFRARRSEALARRLAPRTGTIVVRNGDLFDSERGVVRPRTSVVIRGDRIVAVGPTDSVAVPGGATVIDATGRTVLPGLWDMHTHLMLTGEETGLLHLAAGVTTVRDVAADTDAALSHRQRSEAGTLVGPRYILAGFLEGPGAWAGPSDVLVRTEEEARTAVERYASLGYRQVKLYNLVHPDLVPVIVETAHRRGLRVSGHVPRGLSVPAAIALGFDEIQHAAFLFSTFFQDSLYTPRMRPYSGVATAVAPTFDVDAPAVTALIALLKERGTVIDGTFNLWQDRFPLADGTDPVMGPTAAWMPRGMRGRGGGGGTPPNTPAAAAARAASANYRKMLKRLFDAGVTIVPGTDNTAGFALHGELEIYERAGIPAPAVLQMATITSARVMGDDRDYGSIAPGKVADLVIVAGKPHEQLRDIRKTERVIRAGRVYETRVLYAVLGIEPHWE
jgi:imidazolonepropionase-like amidohydrolase